ncbi:hypothetical protein [Deinococcus sp. JMULE3]|uniref:hypothetical protein n=1 Tax=Deinococcus sp. JMULE3 TaxID=2518341 RepID=UPI001574F354|nr:hypothetical protein [Deinococcus sp. JMULE3]NTY00189.1 hypothetical protein [Deinococcus sp. JMULE3]
MTEQTIDWSTPPAQQILTSVRNSQLLPTRIVLAGTFIVGAAHLALTGRPLILIAATLLLALHLWTTHTHATRQRHAAHASGPTTYQLSDDGTLHVHNNLGQFRIPASERQRTRRYPQAITVTYAGHSTLTLPNGPVRTALEHP